MSVKLLFSDYFEIDENVLDKHGALNICIDADLPLFIDPFLLFASEKTEYVELHDKIVNHLIGLKELAAQDQNTDLKLFQFQEIKQNWLGLCKWGNSGRGLGPKFARDLIKAFNGFYSNFGSETVSSTSHIEKLTLVGAGIGRDFISDFTTNLMLEYLLGYTQEFALKYLRDDQRKLFSVRCKFNKELMTWTPKSFVLPYFYMEDGDYIVLTPLDILTKDDAFICHSDLSNQFRRITNALENASLRSSINDYFQRRLPPSPKQKEIDWAINATIQEYPEILDYYIRYKENTKNQAAKISTEKVQKLKKELITTLSEFCETVAANSKFFTIKPTSYEAALQRAKYLKEVIENNDGYRIFYKNDKAIATEDTIQRIFRLTWFATPFDVNSEVNNGRGPADYKISYGQRDSTIVEFKLASSSSLKQNLLNQTEIYKKASKSITDIKVILCYTPSEISKVNRVLASIKQTDAENIIIIDASRKISASKVFG
ncbi:MAG: hypothetical protein PHF56_22505 [Desulfuromonadaceae bacterium]|nr:hypothetical protein [Desulfuromonadaceae bacterium]